MTDGWEGLMNRLIIYAMNKSGVEPGFFFFFFAGVASQWPAVTLGWHRKCHYTNKTNVSNLKILGYFTVLL